MVLAIDDSRAALLTTVAVLEDAGFAVASVWSAEEGLAEVRRLRPDVIVLDVTMLWRGAVSHGGIKVLEAIRDDPALRSTPVIIYSGSERSWHRAACEALGITTWIAKGSDPQVLIQSVWWAIEGRRR